MSIAYNLNSLQDVAYRIAAFRLIIELNSSKKADILKEIVPWTEPENQKAQLEALKKLADPGAIYIVGEGGTGKSCVMRSLKTFADKWGQ